MERIQLLTTENAPAKSKEVLEEISKGGGKIINIFKAMANSPAVLKTFFGIAKALEEKTLDNAIAERIAIRVATMNNCEYCLAAHCYLASPILSQEEISLARNGQSVDAKAQSALDFAGSVMKNAGKVSDEELEKVKSAGFSEGEVLEIVAVVTQNFFTNSINNVSKTKVDFPKPKA